MIRLDNDWEFTKQWSEAFAEWKCEGKAVRKPGPGKQLFGLLYIDIVDICQRIIIVCLQVRNHRGAELCADTVIDCVYDAVSVAALFR